MKTLPLHRAGLILTMPVAFFEDRKMTPEQFTELFERFMNEPDHFWNFKKKHLPIHEPEWVYLVWSGKVQFRMDFDRYERNTTKEFADSWDGRARIFHDKNWIIMRGPAVRAPYDIPMKGFQGHRYTEQIF